MTGTSTILLNSVVIILLAIILFKITELEKKVEDLHDDTDNSGNLLGNLFNPIAQNFRSYTPADMQASQTNCKNPTNTMDNNAIIEVANGKLLNETLSNDDDSQKDNHESDDDDDPE